MGERRYSKEEAAVGIIAWEKGLPAFSRNVGDIMNPETFDFPVRVVRVDGANYETIVANPRREIVERMVLAAQRLEGDGVCGVTTSCGFNVHIQRELADAVMIPVFASSLLLVPLVYAMLGGDQVVGLLTADARSLRESHFEEAGITSEMRMCIEGLENTRSFSAVGRNPSYEASRDDLEREVLGAARRLAGRKEVGGIVLECTNLPPFAQAIRREVRLPVLDIVSLVKLAHTAASCCSA